MQLETSPSQFVKTRRQTYPNLRVNLKEPEVLVVEDDITYWPFWEKVLRFVNSSVIIDWSTNMRQAEALIRHKYCEHHPYDLVIADVYLEGDGTGIDLWNRYGEEADNFIFVSGRQLSRSDLILSLHHGCPAYLRKPLTVHKCLDVVGALLRP